MATNVTFDPVNKIIQVIKAPVGSLVEIDFKQDIYSDGKEDWLSNPTLNKYKFPIRAIGGNAISDVRSLGTTFFLLYGWRIRPYEGNHRFVLTGNVYTDPSGYTPFSQTVGSYNVMIESTVSNIIDTISTGGGSSGLSQSDINDVAAATDSLITQNHGSGSYSTSSLQSGLVSTLSLILDNTTDSLQVLSGKWQITTDNKLIMYNSDNTTPLYEFNLYDINGNLTTGSVARREPI